MAATPVTGASAIEVDTSYETDSAVGSVDDQLSAFSQSITSSVTAYPVEHGRRYHAFRDGAYLMPNDENEQDRLDLMHHLFMKVHNGKHFLCPISRERVAKGRILDIGTGTGIWAMEMGDEFPDAEILGNDLSPVQPTWVPPNVKFEVDDVESEWSHAQPFDLIFCRYMTAALADWPKMVRNAFAKTRPGGWFEIQDFDTRYRADDGSLPADAYITQFVTHLVAGANKMGRDPLPGPKLEGWLADAGFVNVGVKVIKVPMGPWAKDKRQKEIGLVNLAQALEGMEAFSYRLFTGVLGWRLEEVQVLIAKVRAELTSKSVHPYYLMYVAYGQKPEE